MKNAQNKKNTSFVIRDHEASADGASSGTRTHTEQILSLLPLPIGLWRHSSSNYHHHLNS